jgi:hypothetical protein
VSRSVHTIKKIAEALVVAGKETGIEVNANKTKHMVMSLDQNSRPSRNIKIDNRIFERVEYFEYLGHTLTNQISILGENKSRMK